MTNTPKIPDRDEAAIIAAILAGDVQRYHSLIAPYERTVFMVALSVMKNEADAEEVAQEAFLKAYRSLSTFRAESRFGTWLVSITLNEARSWLRRKASARVESLDALQEEGGAIRPALLRDWREIPSEVLERSEVRQLLEQAVLGLPEIYRQVLVLRDVEGLSIRETADALSISIPSVKVRLHRARIMLQKQLAPQLRSLQPKTKWRWLPW